MLARLYDLDDRANPYGRKASAVNSRSRKWSSADGAMGTVHLASSEAGTV